LDRGGLYSLGDEKGGERAKNCTIEGWIVERGTVADQSASGGDRKKRRTTKKLGQHKETMREGHLRRGKMTLSDRVKNKEEVD